MFLDELDKPLEDVVSLDPSEIADFNESNILPQNESTLENIRTWLDPTNYDHEGSEYQTHLHSHLQGTGRHVLLSPAFRKWHENQEDGILWIRGIPGAGKSVVAATLIDHLSQEGRPVLYFFFRATIRSNSRPKRALRDCIHQVLQSSPPLQLKLLKYLKQSIETLTLAELWELLRLGLENIPKAYLMLDGMDEMNRDGLEDFLAEVHKTTTSSRQCIKAIISSRPLVALDRDSKKLQKITLRLDKRLVNPSITVYARHRLGQSHLTAEIQDSIVDKVVNRADGLFLYARLALDAISAAETELELQGVVEELPKDLSVMYRRILREQLQISGMMQTLQQLILQLVTHAIRPLRLLEIADCINTTQPQLALDTGKIKSLIPSICGSLLEVLPDETVRVVHHSFTEYLLGCSEIDNEADDFPMIEPGSTHDLLAQRCIRYLQSGCLDLVHTRKGFTGPFVILDSGQIYTPFTDYASRCWFVHIQKATAFNHPTDGINKALDTLLFSRNKSYPQKISLLSARTHTHNIFKRREQLPHPVAQALHLVIPLGLTSFTERILRSHESDIISYNTSSKLTSLLHLAITAGHIEIARLLIRYGVDLDRYDDDGATPLHVSLWKEHESSEMIQILLEAGADPWKTALTNDEDSIGPPPFIPPMSVALRQHNADVALLFTTGIENSNDAKKALSWAIEGNQAPAVIQSILDLGLIDINGKDNTERLYFQQTPLFVACSDRNAELIDMLLKAGADPNIPHDDTGSILPEGEGFNVLHALAANSGSYRPSNSPKSSSEENTRRCFTLVLEAGANVHQVDYKKITALHQARDLIAIQCLLEAGANPGALNKWGETALDVIRDDSGIRLLLNHMDINAKMGGRRQTMLQKALSRSYSGDWVKAKRLLEFGADATILDDQGNSALHFATHIYDFCKPEAIYVLQNLINQGLDPQIRNTEGDTAMHILGFSGSKYYTFREKELTLFLETTKADLQVTDRLGRTPLFKVFESPGIFTEILSFSTVMMKYGARLDVTDNRGRTLAHAALRHRHLDQEILRLLIEKGVDLRQADDEGNTIWHEAAVGFRSWRGSPDVFELMRTKGLDCLVPNNQGRLPIHRLCEFSDVSLTIGPCFKAGGNKTMLDYLVEMEPKTLNHKDIEGICPFHIAATHSSNLTKWLLSAGADATLATNEGLTALHLAARLRQSNTVGILVEWLKAKYHTEDVRRALDAKDVMGRTPLYYACASGRTQIVELLLEAGANIQTANYNGSPWSGCADFEDEQKNWRTNEIEEDDPDASSVLISDTIRLKIRRNGTFKTPGFPVERINDILDLLIDSDGVSHRDLLVQALLTSSERNLDYTVECLMCVASPLKLSFSPLRDAQIQVCLERRAQLLTITSGLDINQRLKHLMKERFYKTIPGLAMQVSHDLPQQFDHFLQEIVSSGFEKLVDEILTPQIVSRLNVLHEKDVENIEDALPGVIPPLLFTACLAEQPNMNTVRTLVQKGSKINLFLSNYILISQSASTILHGILHSSRCRWWHLKQALPYLLESGLDLELKDHDKQTPLIQSLRKCDDPGWDLQVTESLLLGGANPNASDRFGKSCIAHATSNQDAYRLITKYGGVVDPSALRSAIRSYNISLLKVMLQGGANPNGRKVGQEIPHWTSPDDRLYRSERCDPGSEDELYPLDLILCAVGRNGDEEACRNMINLLLDHGADLNARYPRTTIIHRALKRMDSSSCSAYSQPSPYLPIILEHSSLDVDLRDEDGVSLFSLACAMGNIDAAEILQARGANMYLSDNQSKNSLHHLIYALSKPQMSAIKNIDFLKRFLALAPSLLKQVDKDGFVPLHYAYKAQRVVTEIVKALVAAGADVSTANVNTGNTALHDLFRGGWLVSIRDPFCDAQITILGGPRKEIFELSLGLGADVNARNRAGKTPIFHFFQEGYVEIRLSSSEDNKRIECDAEKMQQIIIDKESVIYEYFEQNGVHWGLRDHKRQTLLHVVASKIGYYGFAYSSHSSLRRARFEYLLGRGLDALQEDDDHRTPLDVAATVNATDVLELFRVNEETTNQEIIN